MNHLKRSGIEANDTGQGQYVDEALRQVPADWADRLIAAQTRYQSYPKLLMLGALVLAFSCFWQLRAEGPLREPLFWAVTGLLGVQVISLTWSMLTDRRRHYQILTSLKAIELQLAQIEDEYVRIHSKPDPVSRPI